MSNYRRSRAAGATYFFTVVTNGRRPLFQDASSRIFLRQAVAEVRSELPFTIDAWVLLPDHLHCLWTLPDKDSNFPKRWGRIKALFSRNAREHIPEPPVSPSREKHRESGFWQRRFWEHQIRDEDDFRNHMDYIHYNPVKHGLTRTVADWPHSTFHRLVRQGIYPADWGGEELTFGGEYGE